MKINRISVSWREIFAFVLPTVTILSQWFSVAGINISWILYILLLFFLFVRYQMLLRNAGLLIFAALTFGLPIITYLWGIAKSFPTDLYFSLITGMVVMFFICLMSESENSAFMWGVVCSCILFTVWGIYEISTGNYLLFNNKAFFVQNWVGLHYPGVAFANTNDLVQYLALLYPISGYLLLKRSKWMFALLTLAVIFVTFQASSKLGMISLVLTLVFAYTVSIFMSGNASKTGKLILIGVAIVLAIWLYDAMSGTIRNIINNFFVIDSSADYYTGRDDIYVPLIKHSFTHPFGGFGSAYKVTGMTPHNLLLYILCDYGWVPCIIMVVFLVRMTLFAFKKAREQEGNAFWCLLTVALCIFVVTSSISSCNEQRKAVWMFLGICVRNVYRVPYGGGATISSKRFEITLGR